MGSATFWDWYIAGNAESSGIYPLQLLKASICLSPLYFRVRQSLWKLIGLCYLQKPQTTESLENCLWQGCITHPFVPCQLSDGSACFVNAERSRQHPMIEMIAFPTTILKLKSCWLPGLNARDNKQFFTQLFTAFKKHTWTYWMVRFWSPELQNRYSLSTCLDSAVTKFGVLLL